MAIEYGYGDLGLPVDQAKCIDLLRESAGLGCHEAQFKLGVFHATGAMGLEQSEEEALSHWKKAAEEGSLTARHNVGCKEYDNGNRVAAMRHWRLSAAGGWTLSMEALIGYFEDGLVHHGDLAKALRAFYHARDEMKSKGRDHHINYLKMIGEYGEELEL
jgi:TPR repeat protein